MLIKQIKYIPFLVLLILLLTSRCVNSQIKCSNTTLEESLKAYKTGNFNKVFDLLNPCLATGFGKEQKVQAYRLIAMTYIALDDNKNAILSVKKLLEIDPDFPPTVFDPMRFQNLVNDLKQPVTKLVTASKQAEPIEESPVPVTIITDRMIEDIGAKNLKEVLLVYVPGMTDVIDHNEINVAMHGVYASSQQKILIMLNGHRLNSRAYSEANPDFSISLDKIKQIEVLRGPASSLYGNVALTSVINIITKKGNNVKGAEIKAGIGNYGQKQISLLYGNGFNENTNLLLWGNYYQSDGEYLHISKEEDHSPNPKEGDAIIGGVKDKPSYDLGMVLNTKDLSVLGDLRYCKPVDPFTAGGITGEVYDYDKYRTFMGLGPGLSSASGHLDIKYDKEFKFGEIMINPYFDHNSINVNMVIDPNTEQFGIVGWNEYSYGSILQFRKVYDFNKYGDGNIIAGAQLDHMKLYDSFFLLGKDGELSNMGDSSEAKILDTGSETIYSGFLQVKHRFGRKLIFNFGARYDNKKRHQGDNVTNISPRLSVIYFPADIINFKLTYSQSFVDAPYWYRYNSLPSYKGSSNLLPEYLTALQFTTNLNFFNRKLKYELNTFYNSLKDFIYRDPEATGDDPRYRNAGELEMIGLENMLKYDRSIFNLQASLTWMYALEAKDYPVTDNEIHNIPSLSGNIIFNINPIYKYFQHSWINITLRFIGKQISPVNTFKNGQEYFIDDHYVDDVLLVNAGIRISEFKNIYMNLTVNNIFDKDYYQGGSVEFPYPQPGRWFMFKLGYKIKQKR